jgi:hypothetical protein
MGQARIGRGVAEAVVAVVIVLLLSGVGHGKVSWVNAVSGNWSDASKWSTSTVPGDSDDVEIAVEGTYTVTLNQDAEVKSLVLGAASGTGKQTLSAYTRTLTINEASSVESLGALDFQGSTLEGPGTLTNRGAITLGKTPSTGSTIEAPLVNVGSITVKNGIHAITGDLTTEHGSTLTMYIDNIYGATGTTLDVTNGINHGTIELTAEVIGGVTLGGGTLVNASDGTILVNRGTGGTGRDIKLTLDNQGVINANTYLTFKAPLTNSGQIQANSGVSVSGIGSSFTNRGQVNMVGGSFSVSNSTFVHDTGAQYSGSYPYYLSLTTATTTLLTDFSPACDVDITNSSIAGSGPSITVGPDLTVSLFGDNTIGVPVTIKGDGTVGVWNGASQITGLVTVESGGGFFIDAYTKATTLTVSEVVNWGEITLKSWSGSYDATLAGAKVTNMADPVNSKYGYLRTYSVGGGRTLAAELDNQGTIVVEQSPLTIDKTSAHHTSSGTIYARQNLTVLQTGTDPPGVFTNTGWILMDTGKTMTVTGGTFTNGPGGQFRGSATFDVSATAFTNQGILSPSNYTSSNTIGTLSFTGDVPSTSTAETQIDIGGLTPGTQYDQINITGTCTIAGMLTVTRLPASGFNPAVGDSFTIVTCGAGRTGIFDAIDTTGFPLTYPAGRAWVVSYLPTSVVLSVIASAPDIQVKEGTTTILDSGTYDFGTSDSGIGKTVTFAIENVGNALLTLNGPPLVRISGTNAADFVVTVQPAGTVDPGGSSPFSIRFTPSTAGTRTATVTIYNDDPDENPYNFTISGTGTAANPEINVRQGATDIASGGSYDFGLANVGADKTATFTIQNLGGANLNLTGSPKVQLGGNLFDFAVASQPSSPVAAGGSATFSLAFTPTAEGLKTATITIPNNDSDENPYTFTITGTGHVVGDVQDDFTTDTGWTGYEQGGWERGPAVAGGGTQAGNPDPAEDHTATGDNYILGFVIGGDYANSLPDEKAVISPPVDCSGKAKVFVKYRRWLNVGGREIAQPDGTYVDGDHARVYVSADGIDWTLVWENPVEPLTDAAWTQVSHDITAVAAGEKTVYVKFTMGPTNGTVSYSGWNIDDFGIVEAAAYPLEGTLGTVVMLPGTGYGLKKGKAYLKDPDTGLAVMMTVMPLGWADNVVVTTLKKVAAPALYDVEIVTKDKPPVVKKEEAYFTVKLPEMDSVTPPATAGGSYRIEGKFFGTKKGKIYLDQAGVRKAGKVVGWYMDTATGVSWAEFLLPKDTGPGAYDLIMVNKIGTRTRKIKID